MNIYVLARVSVVAFALLLVTEPLVLARATTVCVHTGLAMEPCPCDPAPSTEEARIADARCCRLKPANASPGTVAVESPRPPQRTSDVSLAVTPTAVFAVAPAPISIDLDERPPPRIARYALIQHLLL